MKKNVPTLSKYIEWQHGTYEETEIDYLRRFNSNVFEFMKFYESEPKLWHFIPCNSKGEPMEPMEPLKMCCDGKNCGCMGMPVNVISQEEIDEYYEAQSRVKWVGWEIKDNSIPGIEMIQLTNGKRNITLEHNGKHYFLPGCETYEKLLASGIPLLPTEQTQTDLKL